MHSQANRRRSHGKAPVDTIDLTDDSPPPPMRPRPTPGRVQYVPAAEVRSPFRPKQEPGTTRHSTSSAASGPHIHPDDISRIITTTDSKTIRAVLINLCKFSPALSGAVVRGLRAESSYAQELIRSRDRSRIKSEHSPYVKAERGASGSSGPSRSTSIREGRPNSVLGESSSNIAAGGDIRQPTTPIPRVKAEPMSKAAQKMPDRGIAPGSSSSSRVPSSSRRERTPFPDSIKCTRCNSYCDPEDPDDRCFFHSGRKRVIDDGGRKVTKYSCCNGSAYDVPCQEGEHTFTVVSEVDSLKRERPFSPSGSDPWPHKNMRFW